MPSFIGVLDVFKRCHLGRSYAFRDSFISFIFSNLRRYDFCLFVLFSDRVSIHNSSWPETCCVGHIGLELTKICSTSFMLASKLSVTMPSQWAVLRLVRLFWISLACAIVSTLFWVGLFKDMATLFTLSKNQLLVLWFLFFLFLSFY